MWKNVEQVIPLITKLFQKLKPSGIRHWPIPDVSHQAKILKKSTAGEIPGTGSSKQRRRTSCPCSPSVNPKSCPLTAYLLYGTHPAFKTLHSSLSVFKRKRANSVKLPFPKWFASDSGIFYRNFSDMPSSAIAEDQTVIESPSKRKLSSPASSPQKKLAKLDEAKMPSSVTSSPLKESSALNKPESPVKKFNLSVTSKVPKLQIAKLTDQAHVPTRGSQYAAGYDLKSAYEYTVPKRGSCLIKTDIQIKLPEGTYGRVAPRSGLALKNKIDVGAGVIDQDYRGNVGVILFNHGDEDFTVAPGDRVAQLICEKIEYPEIVEVKSLDETERGEGGFGSTGVKSA